MFITIFKQSLLFHIKNRGLDHFSNPPEFWFGTLYTNYAELGLTCAANFKVGSKKKLGSSPPAKKISIFIVNLNRESIFVSVHLFGKEKKTLNIDIFALST